MTWREAELAQRRRVSVQSRLHGGPSLPGASTRGRIRAVIRLKYPGTAAGDPGSSTDTPAGTWKRYVAGNSAAD